jgi:small subunit ribosomal protein S11
VEQIELILKGHYSGRGGIIAALNGPHGERLKQKIVRVTDATPIIIGGTKAKNKPRR